MGIDRNNLDSGSCKRPGVDTPFLNDDKTQFFVQMKGVTIIGANLQLSVAHAILLIENF